MKEALLTVACCPRCRGALRVAAATRGGPAGELQDGQLQCHDCDAGYPVIDGIPRLIAEDGLVASSRRGFGYQWAKRLSGRAEGGDTIYGYDLVKFMAWLADSFTAGLRRSSGPQWLLDAGCGSGEKARELALRFPAHRVVALDQIDLAASARRHCGVENLHFVQGNVLHPPLRPGAFAYAMSIGVLHHTPDTRAAFDAIAGLVGAGGDFMSWLYPLPEEDSFWAGLYRQRDRHFAGLGHRMEPGLLMALCHLYVALLFPLLTGFVKREYRKNKDRFPIYPDRPSAASLYRSLVFLSFDNLMPRHQFRHGREEVKRWYREAGFGAVDDRYPGFFHALRQSNPTHSEQRS